MAIDLETEALISLAEASRTYPGRPSVCTLWRWRHRGIRGRRLESVCIGGRVFTSREALLRFAEHQGGSVTTAARTPSSRARAIEAANKHLDDARIS